MLICLWAVTALADPNVVKANHKKPNGFLAAVQFKVTSFLGRPYAYGAAGPRRFDCSGFVWRVMHESGIHVKRTSARKLFVALPKASKGEEWRFGNIVFFRNLKHCGIVRNNFSFYHASRVGGTTCSDFDPYWRTKIYGFRKMPVPQKVSGQNMTYNRKRALAFSVQPR